MTRAQAAFGQGGATLQKLALLVETPKRQIAEQRRVYWLQISHAQATTDLWHEEL